MLGWVSPCGVFVWLLFRGARAFVGLRYFIEIQGAFEAYCIGEFPVSVEAGIHFLDFVVKQFGPFAGRRAGLPLVVECFGEGGLEGGRQGAAGFLIAVGNDQVSPGGVNVSGDTGGF